MKQANVTENIATPKKKALAIPCICFSVSRSSFAAAIRSGVISWRVSFAFMSLAPSRDRSCDTLGSPQFGPFLQHSSETVASARTLLYRAFPDRLVVAIVGVADPDSLPAPRCRLPTPARRAIEADTGDERCRR